jgi:hypothetical protein
MEREISEFKENSSKKLRESLKQKLDMNRVGTYFSHLCTQHFADTRLSSSPWEKNST